MKETVWNIFESFISSVHYKNNTEMTGCYDLALKHEKEKGSYSVVKEAREFAREIDLRIETEFDEEMRNMENARKLK